MLLRDGFCPTADAHFVTSLNYEFIHATII